MMETIIAAVIFGVFLLMLLAVGIGAIMYICDVGGDYTRDYNNNDKNQ